ncbi:recombinase family protein [Streptomyces caeni]|uniref:Recombinase family protein n=1 Tax=Streptomyces caeni TaxID=2307231 RepID=A0ABW4J1N7_9ACTN
MIRFAFAGRCSTEDLQDPEASRNWQLTRARALIEPAGGQIVTEYFDIGHSRSLPWQRRPRANDLLRALREPNRGFDAVVIGEPQRTFYGNQFGNTFPVFVHFRIPLWVPEVGGPIDPDNEAHDLVMSVFGGMSKGERNRIKIRVRTAMSSQAKLQGRYLGGRPPYGYRIADAGPHPNPAKAAAGQCLHKLDPDPATGLVVLRIFSMYVGNRYIDGMSDEAIALRLNREGIPCPSAHDAARNPHRTKTGWQAGAVRTILLNPRYTGHEVWNKQRREERLIDVDDVTLGHRTTMTHNPRDEWIWSNEPAHTPLITKELFEAAQRARRQRARAYQQQERPTRRSTRRPYVLRGRVRCTLCGRKMQPSAIRDRVYYRCEYKEQEAALYPGLDHPRTVNLREDIVCRALDAWIARAFTPKRLPPPSPHSVRPALRQAPHRPNHPSRPRPARRSRNASGVLPATRPPWTPEPTQPSSPSGSTTHNVTRKRHRRSSTPCRPSPGRRNRPSPPTRSGRSLRDSETSHSASRPPTPTRRSPSTKPWASRSPTTTQRGPRPSGRGPQFRIAIASVRGGT